MPDVERFLLTYLVEVAGTKHRGWHCAVVLLIKLGLDECTFDGECCWSVEVLLAKTTNTVVHATETVGILDFEIHI